MDFYAENRNYVETYNEGGNPPPPAPLTGQWPIGIRLLQNAVAVITTRELAAKKKGKRKKTKLILKTVSGPC